MKPNVTNKNLIKHFRFRKKETLKFYNLFTKNTFSQLKKSHDAKNYNISPTDQDQGVTELIWKLELMICKN